MMLSTRSASVAIDGSVDSIRERTGCEDLEDAFVAAKIVDNLFGKNGKQGLYHAASTI